MILLLTGTVAADGIPGSVKWSDGRTLAGAISLASGKELRLFTDSTQVSLPLTEIKEIQFKPEKEEMFEGFYFPNAGQATQAKTGEIYPVRYLKTEITLANGKIVTGHLFTTTFYVETDDATEKVVVMAKQTGANGQKLTDVIYPTLIHFDGGASSAGFAQIDLTQSGITPLQPPVILVRPDLSVPPTDQTEGKPIWTVPAANPQQLLFAVEANDGVHVSWPGGDGGRRGVGNTPAGATELPPADVDPAIRQAVDAGLATMHEFFDTRASLGSFADGDTGDVYSLVLLKRAGKTVDGNGDSLKAGQAPWSLVMLRWKYDADQKKVTLLNRALLKIGGMKGNLQPPQVFKEPGLLKDISRKP